MVVGAGAGGGQELLVLMVAMELDNPELAAAGEPQRSAMVCPLSANTRLMDAM